MRIPALLLALSWLNVLAPAPLAALPPGGEGLDADSLYQEGKADLKDGRVASALEKFQMGLAARPADETLRWGLLIGAGLAAEKLGHTVAALEYLEDFLEGMEARPGLVDEEWRSRRAAVLKRSRALEAEVLKDNGVVTVTSQPAGARVLLDGRSPNAPRETRTPVKLFLPASGYGVRLEKDGFAPVVLDLKLKAGSRETLHVPLAALVQVAPTEKKPAAARAEPIKPATPIVTELAAREGSGSGKGATVVPATPVVTRRAEGRGPAALWGWLALGGGAAVALAGVPLTILAVQDADAMGKVDSLGQQAGEKKYNSLKASVESKQTAAWVLYGGGLALAAGGAVYLAFFAERGGREGTGTDGPSVTVTPLPGGGMLGLGGRW